jgi:hypothetical protein
MRLRNDLAKTIMDIFKTGRTNEKMLTKSFTDKGEPIISISDDFYCKTDLLFCGSTNCAGKVVQLLGELFQRNVQMFINLYPDQCLGPVSSGTMSAKKIFGLHGMAIINVAIPVASLEAISNAEAIVDFVEC